MSKNFWKMAAVSFLPLTILTLAVIWFGIAAPALSYHKSLSDLSQKKQDLAVITTKVDSLKKANSNYTETTKMIETVNNLLPDKEDVSSFIVELQGLADDKKVSIPTITISESVTGAGTKKAKQNYTSIKFSLDGKESYGTILSLITGLESLARFNSVDTLTLTSNKNNSISFTIDGRIYAN